MINMRKGKKKIMSNEWTGVYWNTRLVEKKQTFSLERTKKTYFNISFEIHEVHYDKNHNIVAWTQDPIQLNFYDYDDAKGTIKHIKDALKRTVLRLEDDKLIDTGKYLKQYKENELTDYDVDKEYEHYIKKAEEIINEEMNKDVSKKRN